MIVEGVVLPKFSNMINLNTSEEDFSTAIDEATTLLKRMCIEGT